ncbi:MAG: glycoside hydrolase family 127 protein [Clostridia bacterium]|nr:glycoside hydrolase family 127 protein [Clostridia bacterium]
MNKWNFYTSDEIKPGGWLKKQLEIQAEGLSGNLDKIWPDIKDSSWIGGDKEGWERVPYWLDGFIPLAYLLKNEDMIARAKKYIDAIISFQKPDGWICPCKDDDRKTYDTWAVQLISKTLTVYYECSKDEQIPNVIYRVLKNYYEMLKNGEIVLFDWGKARWFECFIAINFIYERCAEEWLKDLAKILKEQGLDYNEAVELWKRPLNRWRFDTHIVNIGMMLKSEAVSCNILGEEYTDNAEKLHEILKEYNGTPVGLFTGDECLSGLSPIQGTELCSVAEQMYSYEILYAYTGNKKWAERLEMLAFNALPATISDDMWTHQYDQMSNQIACIKFPGKPIFRTNGDESHLFGLEPNYGCCTANFNQAWPKFALSVFMYNGDTVINAVPVPSELEAEGKHIKIETDYPFENSFRYTVETDKNFTFKIRIPSFAKNLTVNGEAVNTDELSFEISAGERLEINIGFDAPLCIEKRPHDLNSVRCGSLVFSLPIKFEKKMLEYERNGVERKFPYCDYELIPVSDWCYAYCGSDFEICRNGVGDIPFSSQNPPVTIKTNVKKINWGFEDGYEIVCAKIPESREAISEKEEVLLCPYGCAKLRMTELPITK